MLDQLIWLLGIAYAIYYIHNNTFWFKSIDKVTENLGKKLAKIVERDKKWSENGSKASKDALLRSQTQLKHFSDTYEKYLHLIEKYKHDGKLKRQVRKDWESYLKSIKTKLECDMDYGMDLNDNMLKNTGMKNYKAKITIDEVEKRFKNL